MQRREFITLLGGAAFAPIAARAQSGKIATIGVLIRALKLSWQASDKPCAMRAWSKAAISGWKSVRPGAVLRGCRIWPKNSSVSRSI